MLHHHVAMWRLPLEILHRRDGDGLAVAIRARLAVDGNLELCAWCFTDRRHHWHFSAYDLACHGGHLSSRTFAKNEERSGLFIESPKVKIVQVPKQLWLDRNWNAHVLIQAPNVI